MFIVVKGYRGSPKRESGQRAEYVLSKISVGYDTGPPKNFAQYILSPSCMKTQWPSSASVQSPAHGYVLLARSSDEIRKHLVVV